MSQLQVTGEAKIRDIQGPVVANDGVVTALDGAASQYVRGDGTLADFPTSSGGGSSVSYYLNSSVSQGTIGGVAYRELSKDPIIGTGTDIAISSNGYVANYITDVNDPDVTIVAGGNFNCEFYFSVSNDTGNPTTYAELYKYDGTTFTLLGTSAGVPESINQGTIIAPYYFAIPVPTSALALTDRLAIRIYVNVDGRTVTLHTENGHLCQVVTTLSKGMVSLNNLTDQSQFLTTGTAGTNFTIASSGDTHTFNLPVASATNTGKLSSTDWSTFNNKQNALTNPITGLGASGNVAYFDGASSITSENSFNYDASTNRLGVNTSVPNATIGANAGTDSGYSLLLKNDNANYNSIGFATDSTYGNMITADRLGAAPSRNLTLYNYAGFISITEAGNLGIGLLTPNNGIDIYHATQSQLWLHNNATGVSSTDGVRLALFNSKEANLRNFDGAMSISAEGDFSVITIGAENFRINSTDGSIYQSKVANAILKSVSGVITAAVANTDYQAPITLTTTGSSGPATLSGSTLNIPDYSTNTTNFVTISGTQTITGTKTFNEAIRNESGLLLKNGVISGLAGYTSLGGSVSNGLVVQLSGSANQQTLSFQTGGAYSYTFPASTGTLALTSDLSSYVPTSRTLTINGETYDLSANRTWTISGITGSGAVGRVAYWNGTSSVTSEAAFNYDDNLNRLGVNTNSPNATIGSNANTDSGFSLLLKNSDTNYSGIGFATDSTYGNMIETVRIGTAPSRNLTLYNYAGFISLTEAGNLGVGILTPNTGIDIYHSTISSLWLHTASSGTSGTDGVRLFLNGSNNNAVLRNNEGSLSMSSESDFFVITLGAENIRVNSANGYVGIGNPTTLTSILTVNGAITQSSITSAILKANASGTLVAAVAGTDYVAPSGLSAYVPTSRTITINGTSQNLTADSSYTVGTLRGNGVAGRIPFYDGTQTFSNTANFIWDDTNGYLGVNNTPQIPLDVLGAGFNVSGTTMNIVARFLKDKSATFNGIGLGYDTSSRTGIIYADTATGPSNIAFWTYNTSYAERMRITGAGNVGIGTSSPYTKFQVNGGNASILSSSTAATDGTGDVRNAGFAFKHASADLISALINTTAVADWGLNMHFNTRQFNAVMPATPAMTITAGQNVGIGTSSPEGPLQINGAIGGGYIGMAISNYANNIGTTSGIDFGTDMSTCYNGNGNGQIAVTNTDGTTMKSEMNLKVWNGSSLVNGIKISDTGRVSFPAQTAQNYGLSNSTASIVLSGATQTVASCTITSVGKPIFVNLTGDINPLGGSSFCYIYIYRNGAAVGKYIIAESPSNSTNIPFALTTIDIPGSGTHTYTAVVAVAGPLPIQFGETGNGQAPTILAIELL